MPMVTGWGLFVWGGGFWGGIGFIPVTTDRTNSAYYTHDDLNRVGNDVQCVADLLNYYGYAVTVAAKTDWVIGNIPRSTAITQYLTNLNMLKAVYYSGAVLPPGMSNIKASDANNIEIMLKNIEAKINRMLLSWYYCGEIGCGET